MKYSFRFVALAGFFVVALVVSNILAVKLVEISGRIFPAATPLTYAIVNHLKRRDGVDAY